MLEILKGALKVVVNLVLILTGAFFIRKWYSIKNPLEPAGTIDDDLNTNDDEYASKEGLADSIYDEKDEDAYKEKVEGQLI